MLHQDGASQRRVAIPDRDGLSSFVQPIDWREAFGAEWAHDLNSATVHDVEASPSMGEPVSLLLGKQCGLRLRYGHGAKERLAHNAALVRHSFTHRWYAPVPRG